LLGSPLAVTNRKRDRRVLQQLPDTEEQSDGNPPHVAKGPSIAPRATSTESTVTATRWNLQRLLHRPHIELEVLCLLIVATSFAFMFRNLGGKPFWADESIAVLPANSILTTWLPKSPFDMNYMAFQLEDGLWDPSAPLYRYSVAAISAVLGFSEATARGWSVFLALLLLVPCHALFRRIYGNAVACIAVALLAALPAFADDGREARHFTFVALMMTGTFLYAVRAQDPEDSRARLLWPIFFTATLLGHYIGYLILPVFGAFVVFTKPKQLFEKRYWPAYTALALLYGAIMAKYGNTLPLLHSIGCHNRRPCEPNPFYYLQQIVGYFCNRDTVTASLAQPGRFSSWFNVVMLFPLVFMLIGLWLTLRDVLRDPARRAAHVLVSAWFLIPLFLLSTRDLKFPRYIFYVVPPAVLFVARGLHWSLTRKNWGIGSRIATAVVLVVIVMGPQVNTIEPRVRVANAQVPTRLGWRSRYVDQVDKMLGNDPTADWERIDWQVNYLRTNMRPGDVVVSAFDDASLGYSLGQFVYGFLNSYHDDAFFMNLLEKAGSQGTRVFFMDALPAHNYCHTATHAPRNIDCRVKYAQFYAACQPDSPSHDMRCLRVPIK